MKRNILIFLAVLFIGQIVAGFQQGGRPQQQSGQQGGRGSWSVDVNKNKGRGPQIRTEAQGNIYTSPKGNWQVNGNGYHEFGKGRKPDYGVGITATGRFRRDLFYGPEDEEQFNDFIQDDDAATLREKRSPKDRGSVTVDVNHGKGRGPQIHTEAQGRIYTSPNKNFEINGYGSHDAGRGRKPDYGVGVRATGRFRRDLTDLEELESAEQLNFDENLERYTRSLKGGRDDGRGSWGVSVNKDKGRGPQVRTEAKGNIYKGDKVRVDAEGHHEFGRGRKPDYGGKVGVSGRWRRSVADEEPEDTVNIIPDEFYNEDSFREKRSPQGSFSINATPNGARTDIQRNIYTSPNNNFGIDGNAYHQFGKGQKPTYGGGVTGWAQNDKWSGSVNVNKDKGFGPQVHSEINRNLYRKNNFEINAGGYHDMGAGRKPSYGGMIKGGYTF